MSEESVALLGIPVKEIAVDDACPYTAKLGGQPV